MRFRFLHMADCHLGYRQYNLRERFNDFGRAFLTVIDTAVAEKVDFVLLAGDLFQKRSIDALTLNQAMRGLERLHAAGIPCIAVEGNHEHAYFDEHIGWMEFLAVRRLLVLLDPEVEEGTPRLKPYASPKGSYIDPIPGVRVHGLRYYGYATARTIEAYAAALGELPRDGIEYTVFMTHAGVEGEVQEQAGGLTARQLAPLRPHADYVALGHIHKPFVREDWVHNPGSPETCSTQEATWPERGYYLVEVDTGRAEGSAHRATLHANARRPFFSITLHVDSYESPQQLYDRCEELVKRRARDHGASRLSEDSRPVVVLHLTGVLPFDRSSLEIARLESIVRTSYQPLHVIVRNNVRATEFPVEVGETVNRSQLERLVLEDLFRRDARFRGQSNRWARIALGLKGLALEGADPATIVDELERQMAELQDGDTAQDNADPRG